MKMYVTRQQISRWPLNVGMFICFALMGIYWIRLLQIGGFSLEAYQVGLLCIILATVLNATSPMTITQVLVRVAPWFAAYLVFMLFLVPAVLGTNATGLVFKQALFITGFICVAALFAKAESPAPILRYGGLLGLAAYLAFTEYSAHIIGKSLLGAVSEFLSSGSFQALIYGFFRPVFNSLDEASDPSFVASLTNSIAVSLLVLSLCFRVGGKRDSIDLVGGGVMVMALLFGLLLNARSVVLAAIACMAAAFAIRLMLTKGATFLEMLYWCAAGLAAVAAVTVISLHKPTALDSILTAFQFEDNSAESRLEQYSWALQLIDERMLLGHGYVETESGYPIHNLFLSSWAYTGIGGFIMVLVFYGGLVAAWLRFVWNLLSRRGFWVLDVRPEWVAVLPILPLFRVWISGAGGLPAYGEWIALAIFFGLLMRNESAAVLSPAGRRVQYKPGGWSSSSAHSFYRIKARQKSQLGV